MSPHSKTDPYAQRYAQLPYPVPPPHPNRSAKQPLFSANGDTTENHSRSQYRDQGILCVDLSPRGTRTTELLRAKPEAGEERL